MGLTSVFGDHACAIDVHCIHLILYIVRLDNLLAHFLHTFRFQNLDAKVPGPRLHATVYKNGHTACMLTEVTAWYSLRCT